VHWLGRVGRLPSHICVLVRGSVHTCKKGARGLRPPRGMECALRKSIVHTFPSRYLYIREHIMYKRTHSDTRAHVHSFPSSGDEDQCPYVFDVCSNSVNLFLPVCVCVRYVCVYVCYVCIMCVSDECCNSAETRVRVFVYVYDIHRTTCWRFRHADRVT